MQALIEKATIGDHVFLEDGGEEIGAVRTIRPLVMHAPHPLQQRRDRRRGP